MLAQVNFTTSDLPIFIINTHGKTIKDAEKITVDMGVIDNGRGSINRVTDAFNVYNGKTGIEIRGHSSQGFPKKQYGIELRDSLGNSVNVPLLGMPSESDWVLNASFTDKTFLRNVLSYKLGKDIGRYASRTRFCEVVIDNQYVGLYILQEKVKRDKARVDIKKLETNDISGDALTGGYIMKIDRIDPGDKYFNSVFPSVYPKTPSQYSPISYIYVYPTAANILPVQQEYIKNYITQFETSLSKTTYKDPFLGYYDYVDMDALVDYSLLNEFVKTIDTYRLSAYLHKNRDSLGGKLFFGPIWDYDISLGLADYGDGWLPSGWEAERAPYEGIWSSPFWIKKIFNDPAFKNKLAKRWNELRLTAFNLTGIMGYLDQTVLEINQARVRNFIRWPIIGVYQWPEYYVGQTYEDEVLYLKGWIIRRYNWIDANLSANYSDVEWLPVDFVKINLTPLVTTNLPISLFAKNLKNISAVEFVCPNPNITFNLASDSVAITINQQGNYTFKILGKFNNEIVALSPEYKISQPTGMRSECEPAQKFDLGQNYPNPFNPSTVIKYALPFDSKILIKIYNVLGQDVKLLKDEIISAGNYEVQFNSASLPSGVYFYRLSAESLDGKQKYSSMKKMIFLK
ncbi:MAG: CotH kinase family protein [Ignavibacteriaceae bacterium]